MKIRKKNQICIVCTICFATVVTKIHNKCDDFYFDFVNFHFWMGMFLTLHPKKFIYLDSSDLLEHLAMLQTSTH